MSMHEQVRTTVLVVDDQPDSLAFLCDALDAGGFTVLVATDGASALERLQIVMPDAVLLDASMPGMDGFEVCRRIKADQKTAGLPVIFMTGLTETAHIVEGFRAGGIDYVTKPVHPDELTARLATHARNARAIRQARVALDVAGHAVLVVGGGGEILWRSDRAEQWISEFFRLSNIRYLPSTVLSWLGQAEGQSRQPFEMARGDRLITIQAVGSVGLDEQVLLLDVRHNAAGKNNAALLTSLTARETEVLYWLALGKTNRDIGAILEMSPRTVNKHLEHIYEKLGVETRVAAAAKAPRELLQTSSMAQSGPMDESVD